MPLLRTPPGALAKTFGLTAATAAVIVVALVEGRHAPAIRPPAPAFIPIAEDPLRPTLAYCNSLGASAADDPTCKATWAQTRAHFFATRATPPQFKRPAQWPQVVRPGDKQ